MRTSRFGCYVLVAIAACGDGNKGQQDAPLPADAQTDAPSDTQADASPDAPPVLPTLSIGNAMLAEGDTGTSGGNLQVTLSAASTSTIYVTFQSADATATQAADYVAASGTLTFAPGTTVMPIPVYAVGDTLDEDDETFTVTLSNPTDATIANATGTVTITDDDTQPDVAIADANALENVGTLSFTVTLSAPSGRNVAVSYASTAVTATADTDYTTTMGTLMFLPGETSKNIDVPVTDDMLFENDETFTVGLSSAVHTTITTAQATGTIQNDDAKPTVGIFNVTMPEGDTGTSTFTFTIALSAPSGLDTTVSYNTADVTATAGSDYVAIPVTPIMIPAGMTTVTVDVTVKGDTLPEPDETFNMVLTNPTNATIPNAAGVGTISNDDGSFPSLSITPNVTHDEGNSGTKLFTFTVGLSAPAILPVTVDYATANGTATTKAGLGGPDYVGLSGTLSFAVGEQSKNIDVTVNGDTVYEADETFTVTLSNAVGANILVAQGTGTIHNDDAMPTLVISDATQAEGDTSNPMLFTVTLSTASALSTTVKYATQDGTAISGGTAGAGGRDYTAKTATLTFSPGQTSKTASVTIRGDLLDEPDEHFTVKLTNPTNATIVHDTGLGTITNDDTAPTISIGDAIHVEGNAGTSPVLLPVTLSKPSGKTITVMYATGDAPTGTLATADVDYTSKAATQLTFAPGVTSQSASVLVVADALIEPNEVFAVNLTSPSNATIATAQGIATIIDDDSPEPQIVMANPPAVTEAATNMVFTVTLTTASPTPVSVDYATDPVLSTATEGTDYTATSGTLVIPANALSANINVPIKQDTLNESTETVVLTLSNNSGNSVLITPSATGSILDNDPIPTLSINNASVFEGNSGLSTATFTVTLSAASGQTVTVDFATADGTATSSNGGAGTNDYLDTSGTLTFTPGSTLQQISVPIVGDTVWETDETYKLNLSNGTNAAVSSTAGSGTGTIKDEEPTPSLVLQGFNSPEGSPTAAGTLTFKVKFVAGVSASSQDITVLFSTVTGAGGGTATPNVDYVPLTNVLLTIPAGTDPSVTDITQDVTIIGDLTVESDESVVGKLTNAINATIATAAAPALIDNDD